MLIPSILLKQLYTRGSLRNTAEGIVFSIKNRLKDASLLEINSVKVNKHKISFDQLMLNLGDQQLTTHELNIQEELPFPLRKVINFFVSDVPPLKAGEKHHIELEFKVKPFGKLKLSVEDTILTEEEAGIPRDDHDDYSKEIIKSRQQYLTNFTKKELKHINHYSVDTQLLPGNIENFIGVAQIPMGLAGPIQVNGEHAQGEFLVPMATTEGTLVASYNRGIKVCNLCGGVRTTVQEDIMQRAPVFGFENALEARKFSEWIKENTPSIAQAAEATSSVAKLQYIDTYLASKYTYLRFNMSTGDAAGQNMVSRAVDAACTWILDNYSHPIERFFLESNFATDKKASQINILKTRGKRVTAEIVFKREVLKEVMRVDTVSLERHSKAAQIGSFLSGVNNNGLHAANGITAMFIATGQDVANVAEASAGILHTELTPENDLYMSITLPSLIIATYGGGTGLSTQKESLELMDCHGKGKAQKLAEIMAAVVLAGEISLASAISSSDFVAAHEKYGRNR
ncbi:hydroxymethylglutaryl-CoA reductase [Algivirga pacifica]|uniref:hydroxymethylglutaryl-CoA reductase (NADPH) n=1 Tax=Algivirga pacifica TaxID=1162670 RepID=A0ABP9DBJ1_9BACT